MTKITIMDIIGEAATLEMMAEEYTEAAHAALKLARIIRDENPSPVPKEKAVEHLLEEISDCGLCAHEWLINQPSEFAEDMNDNADVKRTRWIIRLVDKYGHDLERLL